MSFSRLFRLQQRPISLKNMGATTARQARGQLATLRCPEVRFVTQTPPIAGGRRFGSALSDNLATAARVE
jgi:hypothetical protein